MIDPETGTYTLEALFPNPTGVLLPGQFARIRANYDTLVNAMVIPRRAVVELQGRFQVYAVENDQVTVKEVTLGPVSGNDIVVESRALRRRADHRPRASRRCARA